MSRMDFSFLISGEFTFRPEGNISDRTMKVFNGKEKEKEKKRRKKEEKKKENKTKKEVFNANS